MKYRMNGFLVSLFLAVFAPIFDRQSANAQVARTVQPFGLASMAY